MGLIVSALTSLFVVCRGFPNGFDIFKCTFDSSKRLGRGCAPLLNKAFTLHGLPDIRSFLVKRLSLLYVRDFLV